MALGTVPFVHLADPTKALTPASRGDEPGLRAILSETSGIILLTQTCDIVRDCILRPFVEVAPLVDVGSDQNLEQIQQERRPQFAFVPGVAHLRLAADLDRVMCVEKAVVVDWVRTPGCRTDQERVRLAEALSRKHARFAFPDDFVKLVEPLRQRICGRHGRNSREGESLRALREIKVHAEPEWDASQVDLTFWFIVNGARSDVDPASLRTWEDLVVCAGRFRDAAFVLTPLEDMTGRDYVDSQRLDLDRLSTESAAGS